MLQVLHYTQKKQQTYYRTSQPRWQRIVLLSVLAYEAAGCLLGGSLLVISPDGWLMDMPVDIMNGGFPDFLIPGIILFLMGVLNTAAFITVFRKGHSDWIMTALALGGLAIWFWVEIAILQQLHWLHAMWGLPVILGGFAGFSLVPDRHVMQQLLFTCGIVSSVLYVIVNIIVPAQWPVYNVTTQTVSELSAIGAPTRLLWNILCAPYSLLVVAFGYGMWRWATDNRPLRIAGALLMVYGALGVLWPLAPMHLRSTLASGGKTFSDTMHLLLAVVTEVVYVLALGFAAVSFGRKFGIYSIITFLLLLVFGLLTFWEAPGIATNRPTPFIGIWERINIGVFLLWIVVLAIVLIEREHKEEIAASSFPVIIPI